MRRFFSLFCAMAVIGISPLAHAHDSTMWSTAVGASLGGLVGSTIGKGSGRLAATGAGVFLGGAIGNSVGRSLDRAASPRVYAYDAYTPRFHSYTPTYVAPPGPPPPRIVYVEPRTVEYRRSASPVYIQEGYVGPPGSNRLGRQCREFTQRIRIDGQLVESYGTACLGSDGTWRIVP